MNDKDLNIKTIDKLSKESFSSDIAQNEKKVEEFASEVEIYRN